MYNNNLNNYSNYGYGYNYQPQYQSNFNQPYQNQPQMQNQNSSPLMINNINRASFNEINSYIMSANSEIFALDRDKPILYYKSCDINGKVVMRAFDLTEHIEENEKKQTQQTLNFNINDYVKKEDTKDFVKTSEIQNLLGQISILSERLDKLSRSDRNERNDRNK